MEGGKRERVMLVKWQEKREAKKQEDKKGNN
jgi:hypothetical protein